MTVHRKYRDPATMEGCPRLLITANNGDALHVREDLNQQDLAAIVLRVGYIEADDAPREYIERIGGRRTTDAWVAGYGLARHIHWLHRNRHVEPGPRLLVEGWNRDFANDVGTFTGLAGKLLIALVYYALDPKMNDPHLLLGNGQVLVNAQALQRKWKLLLGDEERTPDVHRLSSTLKTVAAKEETVRKRVTLPDNTTRHERFWSVDPARMVRVAERHNLCDTETLARIVAMPRAEAERVIRSNVIALRPPTGT